MRDSTPTSSPPASASTSSDLQALVDAGLDHIQISFQDSREEAANWIAGAKAHAHKIELSRAIRKHKIAFTVNLVVHRQNLDHLEEMIAFIEQLNPERVEIAHTQYYGWALANRAALMPTRAQLDKAVAIIAEAEKRLAGKIRIDSVVPDYYAKYPKACMGGWGRRLMLINPSGKVLAVPRGRSAAGLSFENVREKTLEWIWQESSSFQRFRGEDWMPEPCRSLRPPHRRLWRLPLPGVPAHRRRHSNRSGVFAGAITFPGRISRCRSEFGCRSHAAHVCFLVCAIAEADHRPVDLPHES